MSQLYKPKDMNTDDTPSEKLSNANVGIQGQTPDEVSFREQALSHVLDGFPYSRMDRIFVKFGNVRPRGYDGMEVGNLSHPVTFVKKVNLATVDGRHEALKKTYHQNLVNLTGISITDDAAYLIYERTGLSLAEIKKYGRLTFDRIAVATICREVFRHDLVLASRRLTSGQIIHGLIYIHDVLRISHGELNCDNVFVNEDGEVHIGNIGESMMKEGKQNGSDDLQGVYDIALSLLNLKADSDKTSMSFYLADHFTKLPSNIQLQDVLKHPFLRIGQGSWYLATLGILYTFGLQKESWLEHLEISDSDTESEEERIL